MEINQVDGEVEAVMVTVMVQTHKLISALLSLNEQDSSLYRSRNLFICHKDEGNNN